MTTADNAPGARMAAEIAEQPSLLAGILDERQVIADIAAEITTEPPRFVLLAARGSSDHAAMYAKYLFEVLLGLPVGLASPSVTTLYEADVDLRDVLLVTVSQSGASPDLLEVTETARKQGARTLALTNTPGSPLTEASELTVFIRAGEERAVAATKSYTCTLLTLYLLVDAMRGGDARHARDIPATANDTLSHCHDTVRHLVDRYRFADRVVTTARGYSYPGACEAALKLSETSYLAVRPYSGADLLHGPVATIDADTAVLTLASEGKGAQAMHPVLDTVATHGADILAIGSGAFAVPANSRIPLDRTAEELAPLIEILPVQRLALELAIAHRENPDQPRGLAKITKTR